MLKKWGKLRLGWMIASLLLFALSACSLNSGLTANDKKIVSNIHALGALKENPSKYLSKMITHSGLPKRYYSRSAASLPPSFDLSAFIPPVGNQGGQESCVGWATGYYAKTFQEGMEVKWDITSPVNQFSPAWVYNQIDYGSDNGAYISDALDLIVQKGDDTWANFPYNQSDYLTQPDPASYFRAVHYIGYQWYSLPYDVATLKSILLNSNVVICRLDVYPDFDNISDSNPVYDDASGSSRGGHALCIIGYDDNLQAFRFVNSWGDSWGLLKNPNDPTQGRGFGWISYNFVSASNPIGFMAWVLVDGANIQDSTIINLPAAIEAENFVNQNGAVKEPCAEGGQDVKLQQDGSWIEFNVNNTLPANFYNVIFRTATPNNNAQLYMNYYGNDQDYTAISNTQGWQNWKTVTNLIYMTQGIQRFRIIATNGVSLNWFSIAPVSSTSPSSSPVSYSSSSSSSSSLNNSSASSVSGALTVQTHQDGNITNTQVNIDYQIVNNGSTAVSLQNLTVRFYFANQGNSKWSMQNVFYTTVPGGTASISGAFGTPSLTASGADQYIQLSFNSSAGSIPANSSIVIQTGINKSDWSSIDNSQDYSFNPSTGYMNWSKVTLYENGTLVWGTEPGGTVSSSSAPATSSSSSYKVSSSSSAPVSSSSSAASSTSTSGALVVQTHQDGNVTNNCINIDYQIVNNGSTPVNLSNLTICYYFTNQGINSYSMNTIYFTTVPGGSSTISGAFAPAAPVKTGAQQYFQISFSSEAGSIPANSSVIIQTSINKTDWSSLDNSQNYSYNPSTSFVNWSKVILYQDGTLVWGTHP